MDDALVVVGNTNILSAKATRLWAKRFIVHPTFYSSNGATKDDLAIVELSRPLIFSETIQPVCLAKTFAENSAMKGVISGWGKSV